MPITTTTDHDKHLTTHTAAGKLSFEEIMTAIRRFWEGQPTKNVLWDFTKATFISLTYGEANEIIDTIRPHEKKRLSGKTAVVTMPDLDFGIARRVQSYTLIENLSWRIKVFNSIDRAMRWFDGNI